MLRWAAVLLLAPALLAPPVQAQGATDSAVTAFVNVSVLPMDRARVLPGQTVVVRGRRIVALGPVGRVRVPAGAVRIDGTGKFLLPGLADMHAHLSGNASSRAADVSLDDRHGLLAYVASGVTTIRNMNGRPGDLTLRAQAASGEIVSPRIYTAGPLIENGTMDSVATARRIVAEQRAAGYDFIKLHTDSIAPEVFDAFAAAVRRAGIPFAGHMPTKGVTYQRVLAAHPRSFEHLWGYSGRGVSEAEIPARAAATRRAGVWICPTLTLLAPAWVRRDNPGLTRADSAMLARADSIRRAVRALHAAGVGLLVGTDIPAESWFATDSGPLYSGNFVYEELRNLVAAGLTPYEALRAATWSPAVMLRVQDSVGTVAVGRRADLVLLNGNPLVEIDQVAHPAGVMLNGRWFTPTDLAAHLDTIEAQLTALGRAASPLDILQWHHRAPH